MMDFEWKSLCHRPIMTCKQGLTSCCCLWQCFTGSSRRVSGSSEDAKDGECVLMILSRTQSLIPEPVPAHEGKNDATMDIQQAAAPQHQQHQGSEPSRPRAQPAATRRPQLDSARSRRITAAQRGQQAEAKYIARMAAGRRLSAR